MNFYKQAIKYKNDMSIYDYYFMMHNIKSIHNKKK